MLRLSREDARLLLARYHFTPTDIAGVFARLGSVQYDPLKPVGRNHDLVLQARVPGYRVDDWEGAAYRDRLIYDAWDKQACLVPVSDWPQRKLYHLWHYDHWERHIFEPHKGAVQAALDELEAHGPLSSLEFTEQTQMEGWEGSWYGPKLIKHVLRALWDTGKIVTHHRRNGRHYYHLPDRVIPGEILAQPSPKDLEENLRWLILRRHQSVGLLRLNADASVWSMSAAGAMRKEVIKQLVDMAELTPVQVAGSRQLYHVWDETLAWLEAPAPDPRMVFLGPLDNLLWDRRALSDIFGFGYVWEVYKPASQRHYGYYVLPVFYGERFVARLDSRLEGGVWHVINWWWEENVVPDMAMLGALERAAHAFKGYLRADGVRCSDNVEAPVRAAFLGVISY